MITRIKVREEVKDSIETIKEEVANFFKSSFSQQQLPSILFPFGVFKQFSNTTISLLEELPTREEIKQQCAVVIQGLMVLA